MQVLDELLPKATGREARVEKKRIRAEQRREREISPGTPCLGNQIDVTCTVHHITDIDSSKVYGTRCVHVCS